MIDPIQADQIISGILDTPSESRSVELKPSTPWNDINTQYEVQNIIKSILGMSNVKDGGKIILGAPQQPDKTFKVEGMSPDHLKTYEQDKIYQAVRNYGSPDPRFEIRNVEYKGQFFIVFTVQDFLYSPVICTKNGKATGTEPLCEGALYIRTNKPETKKVDNETEMREIINLAIEKEIDLWSPRIQRLIGAETSSGLAIVKPGDMEKFLDELKDLTYKDINY